MKKSLLIAFAIFYSVYISAQNPGDLDPTFGNGGIVTTEIGSSSFRVDIIDELAVQPNGKIIAVGSSRESNMNKNYTLVRYNSDGSLDNTFGTNGIVILPNDVKNGFIRTVEVLEDGKILAGGQANNPSATDGITSRLVLFRLLSDGSLDQTFGNGGKVMGDWAGSTVVPMDMKIQRDGKIVITCDYTDRMTLVRYNADGTLDLSFAGCGYLVLTMHENNYSSGRNIVIQDDNKIVLAGFYEQYYEEYLSTINKWVVARVNENGTMDETFGTDGYLTMNIGSGPDFCNTVAIQSDGKIVIGGHTWVSNDPFIYAFVITRLHADGTLDTSFGTDGKFIGAYLPTDQNYIDKIVIAPESNNIYASFYVGVYDGQVALEEYYDMGVLCLTADGQLNENFGDNGYSCIKINDKKNEAMDLVMQPDGKVVLAGEAYTPTGTPFALARFITGEEISSNIESDNFDSNFGIYPNPANEKINISYEGSDFSVQVFEAGSGRLVMTKENEKLIDVSELSNGTYIIKLVSDNEVRVNNFVKL